VEHLPELAHSSAADRQRAVTGRPADRCARPADLLLGHHDRVEATAGKRHREPAELADRVADVLEELGMLVDEVAGPLVAARLLVGQDTEDHVAGRQHAAGLGPHEGREHHRDAALHVQRSASPHVAVVQLAGKRLVAPIAAGRHDIDVSLQEQRSGHAPSGKAGDQVGAGRIASEDPDLASEILQQPADPVHAFALVAGGIARIETQQPLQDLDGTILDSDARHRHSLADLASARPGAFADPPRRPVPFR
jgi:hypothetical protein